MNNSEGLGMRSLKGGDPAFMIVYADMNRVDFIG